MSNPKLVHHYDKNTGEYVRSTEGKRSPADRGEVYLVPANATLLEPLEVPSTHKNVFDDGQWKAVEDHRGTKVYHKETLNEVVWNKLGEIDEIYTELVPRSYDFWNGSEWEKDADKLLEQKNKVKISLEKEALLYQEEAGVNSNFFGLITSLKASGQTNPKLDASKDWLDSLWAIYFTRKADLFDNDNLEVSMDFTEAGVCPHSFTEVRTEAGL